MYDAAIIGGSYAGLAAALQLARARRKVLVIDEGVRRNRFASHAHGFLGQDGRDPAAIVADGKAEVLRYSTVDWFDGRADDIRRIDDGFTIATASGRSREARYVVLATGVNDILPDIPGLAERWGRHVFHCPYCHGYELERGHIGVLATSAMSMHQALMLPDWGQVTFFINGVFEPSADELEQLAARKVAIERTRVRELAGGVDVVLEDGRAIALAGLFTAATTQVAGPIAAGLGCEFDKGPLGDYIRVDAFQQTSVPGVFACGDAARAAGSVSHAVGDGVTAGVAAHRTMLFGPI